MREKLDELLFTGLVVLYITLAVVFLYHCFRLYMQIAEDINQDIYELTEETQEEWQIAARHETAEYIVVENIEYVNSININETTEESEDQLKATMIKDSTSDIMRYILYIIIVVAITGCSIVRLIFKDCPVEDQ